MSDDGSRKRGARVWLAGAAVSGVLAGITRAVTSWLLEHLPYDW
ncbi:hypothetical protein [Actinoplanes italicus]|nr:hypothetical protein [Actinoplanes italicus]